MGAAGVGGTAAGAGATGGAGTGGTGIMSGAMFPASDGIPSGTASDAAGEGAGGVSTDDTGGVSVPIGSSSVLVGGVSVPIGRSSCDIAPPVGGVSVPSGRLLPSGKAERPLRRLLLELLAGVGDQRAKRAAAARTTAQ